MEKKIAAALAAVSAYMQQEQEAYAEAVNKAMEGPKAPAIELNLWGQSGRQGMMTMRNLMQMKGFDRSR
ncbi:MAG: hypothetical protein P8X96_02390 [Desulfobacteraceae bacterium]